MDEFRREEDGGLFPAGAVASAIRFLSVDPRPEVPGPARIDGPGAHRARELVERRRRLEDGRSGPTAGGEGYVISEEFPLCRTHAIQRRDLPAVAIGPPMSAFGPGTAHRARD